MTTPHQPKPPAQPGGPYLHLQARPLNRRCGLGARALGGTPEQLRQWLVAKVRRGAARVRGAMIEPQ